MPDMVKQRKAKTKEATHEPPDRYAHLMPRSKTIKPARTLEAVKCSRGGETVLKRFAQAVYILNNDTEGYLCVQHRKEAGLHRSTERADVVVCVSCGKVYSLDKVYGLATDPPGPEPQYICEDDVTEANRTELEDETPEG